MKNGPVHHFKWRDTGGDVCGRLGPIANARVIGSAARYVPMVRFRNFLVHQYEHVDLGIVYGILINKLGDVEAFSAESERMSKVIDVQRLEAIMASVPGAEFSLLFGSGRSGCLPMEDSDIDVAIYLDERLQILGLLQDSLKADRVTWSF